VFRDQSFTADLHSAARQAAIEDVSMPAKHQFREDARSNGPSRYSLTNTMAIGQLLHHDRSMKRARS